MDKNCIDCVHGVNISRGAVCKLGLEGVAICRGEGYSNYETKSQQELRITDNKGE